jgi:transcriptional regulator with XRE-family HTH domain
MDSEYTDFDPTSRALWLLRDVLGLTQKEAEEKGGIPLGSVSKWEKKSPPKKANLEKYLKGLDCSRAEFARFQIQALCEEHGFRNELELALSFEDSLKERVARTRRLLAKNAAKVQLALEEYRFYDDRLNTCEQDCLDRVQEVQRIEKRIKDGCKSRRGRSQASPSEAADSPDLGEAEAPPVPDSL